MSCTALTGSDNYLLHFMNEKAHHKGNGWLKWAALARNKLASLWALTFANTLMLPNHYKKRDWQQYIYVVVLNTKTCHEVVTAHWLVCDGASAMSPLWCSLLNFWTALTVQMEAYTAFLHTSQWECTLQGCTQNIMCSVQKYAIWNTPHLSVTVSANILLCASRHSVSKMPER